MLGQYAHGALIRLLQIVMDACGGLPQSEGQARLNIQAYLVRYNLKRLHS